MTTLYLARHGETEDNVNRIMQGQTQGRLTGNGLRQAAALRDRLRDARIDAIVASDLRRAIDTAAVVATPRGMTVETTPLLRERDWGSFTGRFIPSLRDEPWPDDIESLDALKARAASFMEWLTGRWPGMAVLAVGHGIINKAVQAVYFGKPMSEIPRMENAEVRILELAR